MTDPHKRTSLERLVNDALAIEAEAAKEAGALGFMARALVQATMPHRKTAANEFVRRNGAYALTMLAPSAVGLPYGSVPRLLMAWLTTEAVRTKSRELELGESLSGFMRQLDMVPTGGRWGSITRLKEQTKRLFSTSVSCTYNDKQQAAGINYQLADNYMLWWHPKAPDQAGLWQSTVKLSEQFFKEVIEHPVPVDMRALKALKKSPMGLDLYCWLTYRMSYLRQETEIPWLGLAAQFGANYGRPRDFKTALLGEIKKVVTVYKGANVAYSDQGLILKPSRTHIASKGSGG